MQQFYTKCTMAHRALKNKVLKGDPVASTTRIPACVPRQASRTTSCAPYNILPTVFFSVVNNAAFHCLRSRLFLPPAGAHFDCHRQLVVLVSRFFIFCISPPASPHCSQCLTFAAPPFILPDRWSGGAFCSLRVRAPLNCFVSPAGFLCDMLQLDFPPTYPPCNRPCPPSRYCFTGMPVVLNSIYSSSPVSPVVLRASFVSLSE